MTSSVVALGELFLVGSSKRVLKSQWQSNGVPFYRGREVTKLATDGVVDNELFISEALYAEFASKSGVPSAGDIMVTAIGTIGNSYVVNEGDRFYFKDASVLWLKKRSEVSSEFINLWLKSDQFFSQIDRGNGATVDTLTIQKMQSMVVCLPPLSEQRRIVAILDEAFEAIATVKVNAEKNLQNARVLFESYLSQVLGQRGSRWRDVTLAAATGGICTGPFGSLLHKSDYVDNGIPLINPAHITDVGFLPDFRKSVSASTAQRLSSYLLRQGDIVIGRRGDMGRCAVVTAAEEGWLCGTGSFIIRSSSDCDARFLVRLLRSEVCKRRLEKIAGGAVMPNLSNSDLSEFLISLPPIEIQHAILEDVDLMAQEIQQLEAISRRKVMALNELKKSLLHQAFTGQL